MSLRENGHHLENVSMRPDAGPCLLDPEVEVPVVITVELLDAAGRQPVQPGQQLLRLGLKMGNFEKNKYNVLMFLPDQDKV